MLLLLQYSSSYCSSSCGYTGEVNWVFNLKNRPPHEGLALHFKEGVILAIRINGMAIAEDLRPQRRGKKFMAP